MFKKFKGYRTAAEQIHAAIKEQWGDHRGYRLLHLNRQWLLTRDDGRETIILGENVNEAIITIDSLREIGKTIQERAGV